MRVRWLLATAGVCALLGACGGRTPIGAAFDGGGDGVQSGGADAAPADATIEAGDAGADAPDASEAPDAPGDAGGDARDAVADAPADQGSDGPICPPTLSECGGTCVDEVNDPKHCGGCSVECPPAELCSGGSCLCECAAGLQICGTPCACTNLQTDPNNCGACGARCVPPAACIQGSCATLDAGGD